MIFEIILALLALVFFLVYFGYSFTAPFLAIAGFTILFLLGAIFLANGFEIKTGETISTTYSYIGNSSNINETTTTLTNVYSGIDVDEATFAGLYLSHFIGFILSVIGVFGFIDVVINIKGLKQ